jgi:F-type H+-transporting ATPase subunit a
MEHPQFWIVILTNKLLGPAVAAALAPLGYKIDPAHAIPDFLVICGVIVLLFTALSLFVRSRLSVENPGSLQILLEDVVGGLIGILTEYMGPKGVRFLPLVGTVGLFIFTANMIGKVPGMMSPTSNINVTVGCAVTVWVFYQLMGLREQGPVKYFLHFMFMPGAPWWTCFLVLPIEVVSHLSRVMSLSLRLFGNIYGEEMVVLIIASIVPLVAPLPMVVLGIVTGTLQAFVFVLLTIIYLAAATHTDHEHESHEHDPHGHEAGAHAAA